MRTVRPKVDKQSVVELVAAILGEAPDAISALGSGQIAATFGVEVSGEQYVVQLNDPMMSVGTGKEQFLRARLQAAGVPLREVLAASKWEGLDYTISKRARGRGMNELEPSMYKEAIPAAMDMLVAMWRVDMSDTSGFGRFSPKGEAGFQSWTDHLQRIADEEPEDFYGCWHRLFDETFLDRRLFEHYFERMSWLLSRTPSIRGLVHGGFGYGNVLVDKGSVTAVLDWCDARVGDPVFDIAYMDFWPSSHDLLTVYESRCNAAGLPLPAFADRVLCYKYYDGLDALRFFAKTDNRAAYDCTVEILARLESNGRA